MIQSKQIANTIVKTNQFIFKNNQESEQHEIVNKRNKQATTERNSKAKQTNGNRF